MPLNLSPEAASARDLAKRCVSPEGDLDLEILLSALLHSTHLKESLPELRPFLKEPKECRGDLPEKVPLAENLVPHLSKLARENPGPITPEDLFIKLLWSPPGLDFAEENQLPRDVMERALALLKNTELAELPEGKPEASRAREPTSSRSTRSSLGY